LYLYIRHNDADMDSTWIPYYSNLTICFQPIDNTTLSNMEAADTTDSEGTATVAALNLTTNKWRLVANSHPFTCALCTRAHRADLNNSVISQPAPRGNNVYYGIAEYVTSNSSLKTPPEDLLELLAKKLNVRTTDFFVNEVIYNSRNHTEFYLRIRSSYHYEINDLSSYVISEDYRFLEFYDASCCTYSFEEGMVWLYNKIGG
jgi:hypothetical protein